MAAPDTAKLYQLCQQTEKGLEQIATALGQMGADHSAVDFMSKTADVLRKVCGGLAQNMHHAEPPAEAQQDSGPETPAENAQDAQGGHTMSSAADAMMARHAQAAQAASPQ